MIIQALPRSDEGTNVTQKPRWYMMLVTKRPRIFVLGSTDYRLSIFSVGSWQSVNINMRLKISSRALFGQPSLFNPYFIWRNLAKGCWEERERVPWWGSWCWSARRGCWAAWSGGDCRRAVWLSPLRTDVSAAAAVCSADNRHIHDDVWCN